MDAVEFIRLCIRTFISQLQLVTLLLIKLSVVRYEDENSKWPSAYTRVFGGKHQLRIAMTMGAICD